MRTINFPLLRTHEQSATVPIVMHIVIGRKSIRFPIDVFSESFFVRRTLYIPKYVRLALLNQASRYEEKRTRHLTQKVYMVMASQAPLPSVPPLHQRAEARAEREEMAKRESSCIVIWLGVCWAWVGSGGL